MKPDVKPARGTARGRHALAAEATRTAVVDAAARLFADRGYVGTTIDDIAHEAGVAVQTIYNAVGSKREVLSAVLDRAAVGPSVARSVPELMRARTADARSAEHVVRLLAEWFAEAQPRTSPVWSTIRQAAAVEPQVAQLEDARAAQRYRNYHEAATQLADRAGAAPVGGIEDAAALIWSVGHPEVYRLLVQRHGWPIERYRDWVERALRAALLPARPPDGSP